MDENAIRALLAKHYIPLEGWGVGEAKTLEHLFREIASGEAELKESSEHGLVRTAYGATLDVFHRNEQGAFLLKEEKQVFTDGRERRRNLDSSIGEKMRVGEEARDAARRSLSEELGIDAPPSICFVEERFKGPVPSQSFPGIQTVYIMYHFEAWLSADQFRPEGYIEVQEDKTNFYAWMPVVSAM